MPQLIVGHTPDADDAFMFYGIASGNVGIEGLQVKHVVEDIESLNKKALKHELDITAVSAHAYAYTRDYVIIRSGGSFGRAYGPVVIAKKRMEADELRKCGKIAVPGKMTTAYLLLRMALGEFNVVEMKFSEIDGAVERGEVDAGLVIHEAQITYDKTKLVNTLDLGRWWDDASGGLPLPLGINIASRRLGDDLVKRFDELLKRSIQFGFDHPDDAIDYAMRYARGTSRDIIAKFVKMYVNDITVDMGEEGIRALEKLYSMAEQKGMIRDVKAVVVP